MTISPFNPFQIMYKSDQKAHSLNNLNRNCLQKAYKSFWKDFSDCSKTKGISFHKSWKARGHNTFRISHSSGWCTTFCILVDNLKVDCKRGGKAWKDSNPSD